MPKVIVLIHEKCPHCKIIEKKLGNDERFKVMDVLKNPEAMKLASKLGITTVPYFLYSDDGGQVCTLDENGEMGKCVKEALKNDKR